MTHSYKSYKLWRRNARFRALAGLLFGLATTACGDTDAFDPTATTSEPTAPRVEITELETPDDAQPLASAWSGGIPFGNFAQPTSEIGSTFNGGQRIIYPQYLLRELAAIKARGGRVAIRLSFGDRFIKDADGDFNLNKWKDMVDRYRGLNFSSYINDGTIIGHYLIDEPQDKANWNGKPISQATIEEMARHSKNLWPGMPTIVRTWPDYLDDWNGTYRYLDAAWAQYAANRWPNPRAFLDENVTKAKRRGLALVVGLNVIKGSPSKGQMSASQVKEYGSALLASDYPCAFISWQYRDGYMSSGSIREAMKYLRNKAESRPTRTCKSS